MAEKSSPETVLASSITPTDMPPPTGPDTKIPPQGGTAPSEAHNFAPAGSPPSPDSTVAPGTLDDKGHPFDPLRNLPHKHPHGGHWLPKGGRKPGSQAKSPPRRVASFIPDKVPAPLPDPSAAETNGQESAKNGPAAVDHAADAGEVAARAVQLTAGIVLKAPKETTASEAEHRHMVEATAAYIRSKNWQAAAGASLLLMFGAWLLKVLQQPGPQATVSGWFKPGEQPRKVTPEQPPQKPAAPGCADLPPGVPPLAQP